MARVKAIVDEASMFSVATSSVAQLNEALKSAQSWTSKVTSMLVGISTISCLFVVTMCRTSLLLWNSVKYS